MNGQLNKIEIEQTLKNMKRSNQDCEEIIIFGNRRAQINYITEKRSWLILIIESETIDGTLISHSEIINSTMTDIITAARNYIFNKLTDKY